ncbi:MAG: hypothetical protein GKR98_10585 [Boseongicola sp.]|nr:MAG: hypothetical protein GKR98_10585 [Boseongicola sp.]
MTPRLAALVCLLATPATAWDFSPKPVCTLSNDDGETSVRVTHDPRLDLPYAIQITRQTDTWTQSPVFALRFDGPRSLTISTDRHQLSPDTSTVSVQDRGFGNVLDGIAFGHTATAFLGDQSTTFSTTGAKSAVEQFRNCSTALGV